MTDTDTLHFGRASELGLRLQTVQDIPELLGRAYGLDGLLLQESDLAPEFFDLKTGLLGELFQKCANYRFILAVVIPDPPHYGPRFAELAYEHSTHGQLRFVKTEADGWAWLESLR